MFEQSILKNRDKARRPVTLGISLALQCVVVSAAVVAPLVFTDRLALKLDLTPHPPLRAVRRAIPIVEAKPQNLPRGTVVRYRPPTLVAPVAIRPITNVVDPPVVFVNRQGPLGGIPVVGVDEGWFNSRNWDRASVVPPIPPPAAKHVEPPPPPQPAKREPVKISSGVLQAKAIRQPKPIYPPIARATRIQGVVRLVGVIAKDGTIQQLQVISGHPLLVKAALEAVSQWVYQPTLLNGEPVEVIAPIDVNFTLSQ